MKNKPIKIQLKRKVKSVYVLFFPFMNISLTVNEYYYKQLLNNTKEYEFIN
jgi:hypothetical protein